MIVGKITGDGPTLLRLSSMNVRLRDAIRRTVTRQATALTRYVKQSKLSGQVLKNRTTPLRNSVNYRISETADQVTASVGTNVKYAAAHEYGFDDTVTVRAHVRSVNSRNIRGTIDGKRKKTGQGIGYVSEHERHMHLPERSFLRSSLLENSASIRDQLRAAIKKATVTG